MNGASFQNLEEVVRHDLFPDADLALRKGCHISKEHNELYTFVTDAQALLEEFYGRFQCDLIHSNDSYYYLLPRSEILGNRHLTICEMLVGHALALIFLDPATLKSGGMTDRDTVVTLLAGTLGDQTLIKALNPRKRKLNDHVAQSAVRTEIAKALRSLASLGFIELSGEHRIRLLTAVLRFTDHVRGSADPKESLARLVSEGKAETVRIDNSEAEESES